MKFLFGLIIGICLTFLAGYLFITRGGIYMGTDAKALPLERLLAHQAISASIGSAKNATSPEPADEPTLLAGAEVYQQNGCMGCHGPYGQGATPMSKRMYPHIPTLLPPGEGVTDDPVGMTHWVVQHGIRFSGMPSFDGKLSDKQIWQVSQLLSHADKLPASVQAALRGKQ
jgi:thiosulfate dehydrogenase